MANLQVFKHQFFTSSGVPLSGGKVYTYAAGTTTPQNTYTDQSGATPNTNPVILDSRGEASIWLEGNYKIKITDSTDVEIYTVDDVFSASTFTNVIYKSYSTGSAILPSGTTAQRDGTPSAGYTRFNSDVGGLESWYSAAWNTIATTANSVLLTGAQSIAGIKTFLDGIEITATKAIDFLGTSGLLKVGGTTVVTIRTDGLAVPAATASGDAVQKSQVYQLGTKSCVRLNTANGYGSSATKTRRFTNVVDNTGADITYDDSDPGGATFTINTDGLYAISYTDQFNSTGWLGVATGSTNDISTEVAANLVCSSFTSIANGSENVSAVIKLTAGQVVRANTNGLASGSNVTHCQFTITRVA